MGKNEYVKALNKMGPRRLKFHIRQLGFLSRLPVKKSTKRELLKDQKTVKKVLLRKMMGRR